MVSFAFLLFGMTVLSAGIAYAKLARRGGEFMINSVTEGNQIRPRVAPLPDGGFVVVWQNEGRIATRRFDEAAQPIGPETQVAAATPCFPPAPHVAAAPDGSSLITWCSVNEGRTSISAQRFDSGGQPRGNEFSLAQDWYADLQDPYAGPNVAAVGHDRFVVTWTDDSYLGRGRIVGSDDQSPAFDIVSEGIQYDVAAAGDDDGGFRVVWYDGGALMRGRQFQNDQASGDAFDVARVSSGNQQGPVICSHDSGEFVVAWSTYGPDFGIPVSYRRYSDDIPSTFAQPVTPEEIGALQFGPTIACAPGGQSAIGWIQVASIPSQSKFRIRIFNNGEILDASIGLLDIRMSGSLDVTYLSNGDLLATWQDCGEPSGCDILAQRFTLAGTTECPGDCGRDGQVSIDDLLHAVSCLLAPERTSLMKRCLPADQNLDYRVSIDELVLATRQALEGCR